VKKMKKTFLILFLCFSSMADVTTGTSTAACQYAGRPDGQTSLMSTALPNIGYIELYGLDSLCKVEIHLWPGIKNGYTVPMTIYPKVIDIPFLRSTKQAIFYASKSMHDTVAGGPGAVAVDDSLEVNKGMRVGGIVHIGKNLASYNSIMSLLINPDMDTMGSNIVIQVAPVVRAYPRVTSGSTNNIALFYMPPTIDSLDKYTGLPLKIGNLYGFVGGTVQGAGLDTAYCPFVTAVSGNLNSIYFAHFLIGTATIPRGRFGIYDGGGYKHYLSANLGIMDSVCEYPLSIGGDLVKVARFGTVMPVYILAEASCATGYNVTYDNGAFRFGYGGTAPRFGGMTQFDPNTGSMNILVSSASGNYNDAATMNTVLSGNKDGLVTIPNLGTGTVSATSGVLSTSSDARKKKIKGYFSRGLKEALKVKPIIYNWNKLSNLDTTVTICGFSAQNVRAAGIPEAASQGKDGYFSLDDRTLMATLFNAVRELDARNRLMQSAIDSLKKCK
jgi:hypothetical protein